VTFESTHRAWRDDPVNFWEREAAKLSWTEPWDTGLDPAGAPLHRWFPGGRINAAYNCLDVHVDEGRGETTALLFDSPMTGVRESYTYRQLRDEVTQFAGALADLRLRTGDTVLMYMPAVPETVIAMLACARLGITHSVVPSVPAAVLRDRIDSARPAVILTASAGFEGQRPNPYKEVLDAALCETRHRPRACVVLRRPGAETRLVPARDIVWSDLVGRSDPHVSVVPVESGHPLYLLYTSGSTSRPKAVVRDTGGYLTALRWAAANVFGIRPGDVFWTDSHPGWVMGHSFTVYGALVAGGTTLIYEGSPVETPDAGTFPRLISEYGVNVLFTTPMTLRRIRHERPARDTVGDGRSSLRAVFLASERVEADLAAWIQEFFGCPMVDNWWQTETGWPVASNCLGLGLMPVKQGSVARPLPGYEVDIVDDHGRKVPAGERGNIAIRLPLPPGCLQTLWGEDDRFVATYLRRFPGYYDTSDAGHLDADGYLWIAGRTDDIINVGGDSLSGLDVEHVLSTHPAVERCAVVGGPDEFYTAVPVAFVIPAAIETGDLGVVAEELAGLVGSRVGPWAQLRRFVFVTTLPYTASAKIKRSELRAMLADQRGHEFDRGGGLSVLADVSIHSGVHLVPR
jgi:propionyl-CoA synthetase